MLRRSANRVFKAIGRSFRYSISLPERIIRSLAAVTGGSSRLVTETLLPASLRKTTIYNVSIGMMQRFIVERVAGLEQKADIPHKAVDDDFLQRKIVGTALEAAGLFTIKFSPIWVFAILSDAAGGSKVFLERLVRHLRENDIILEDSGIYNLIDVIAALQDASAVSAVSIDTPPLSREKLSEIVDEMKREYGRVLKTSSNLMPRLDTIWKSMEQLAHREKISIDQLGGIIAVDAVFWSRKSAGLLSAAGRTGAMLFDEEILDNYRKTLDTISDIGIEKYTAARMKPFIKSAKSHFDPARETWIDKKLNKKKNSKS